LGESSIGKWRSSACSGSGSEIGPLSPVFVQSCEFFDLAVDAILLHVRFSYVYEVSYGDIKIHIYAKNEDLGSVYLFSQFGKSQTYRFSVV